MYLAVVILFRHKIITHGDIIADSFALRILQNKEAVISALEKTYELVVSSDTHVNIRNFTMAKNKRISKMSAKNEANGYK